MTGCAICSTLKILKVIDSHKHLHTGNRVPRGSFASSARWFSNNFPDARCGKLSSDNDATWQQSDLFLQGFFLLLFCFCFYHFPNSTLTRTISKLLDKNEKNRRNKKEAERKANWPTWHLCVTLCYVSPFCALCVIKLNFPIVWCPGFKAVGTSWCCWILSEGAETTRQKGIEIEVDRWKKKRISERTCCGEWVGNINFTQRTIALFFSWSGLKQCGLHVS